MFRINVNSKELEKHNGICQERFGRGNGRGKRRGQSDYAKRKELKKKYRSGICEQHVVREKWKEWLGRKEEGIGYSGQYLGGLEYTVTFVGQEKGRR